MITKNLRTQYSSQHISCMQCPNCENFIPASIQQILFSNSLCCPICGLRININKRKSDKALKILEKVDEAQRKVEDSSYYSK